MGIYIGISDQVGKSSGKKPIYELLEFLVLDEETTTHVLFIDVDDLIFNAKVRLR